MPAIRLIATGGTIASSRALPGNASSGNASSGGGESGYRAGMAGAELLARTAVPPECEVDVVDAATVGSFAWRWAEIFGLLRHIEAALDDGVDGVVITHGTDTMEEVAFLVALAHRDPRPVVFTGAQRTADHPAADGPANLADALRVAASPQAYNRGALVVFDGLVFGARGVTKVDTLGARAFDAPGRGPQLRVAREQVRALVPAAPPTNLPVDTTRDELPRVDVVPLYVGADATFVNASLAAGARGVVLAGFGVGNATPAITEAVGEVVASGRAVLVCSRVASGPVLPVYGGGGGADLAAAGAVFTDDLSPWQARMLLAVALANAPDGAERLVRDWLGVQDSRAPTNERRNVGGSA